MQGALEGGEASVCLAFMLSGSENLNGPGGALVSGVLTPGLDSYFVGGL